MPTLRKDKNNQWWARVFWNKEYLCGQFFPSGPRKGAEWTKAKYWEVATAEQLTELVRQGLSIVQAVENLGLIPSPGFLAKHQEEVKAKTVTACARLLAWGEAYLDHAERFWSKSTQSAKNTHLSEFFEFCHAGGIKNPEEITPGVAYRFLAMVKDNKEAEAKARKIEAEKSGAKGRTPEPDLSGKKKKGGKIGNPASVANKYRKNLIAAWNWGAEFLDDFPRSASPFARVKEFPAEKQSRYVPPEEDIVKVLELAQGQDLIMLLVFYFTGARRGEVFKLSWERDVHIDDTAQSGKIRLKDRKTSTGKERHRWYDMHPALVQALSWWRQTRPCQVDNVFMQVHCHSAMGLPFQSRSKFCARLCRRAGVKSFVFYSIRHKSARIVFADGGVKAAQSLLGHYRPTTTNTYLEEEGLLTGPAVLVEALGDSQIGQAAGSLLKTNLPHEIRTHEAECNRNHVTGMVQ